MKVQITLPKAATVSRENKLNQNNTPACSPFYPFAHPLPLFFGWDQFYRWFLWTDLLELPSFSQIERGHRSCHGEMPEISWATSGAKAAKQKDMERVNAIRELYNILGVVVDACPKFCKKSRMES